MKIPEEMGGVTINYILRFVYNCHGVVCFFFLALNYKLLQCHFYNSSHWILLNRLNKLHFIWDCSGINEYCCKDTLRIVIHYCFFAARSGAVIFINARCLSFLYV